MQVREARILILCKTYPSPSGKYSETSCVAGMEEGKGLIRLFPVPFRLISQQHQFKKWQWITAKVKKARNDSRPESHTILVDTIEMGDPIPTTKSWAARRLALQDIPTFYDFQDLEAAQLADGRSLGFIKPEKIISLDIKPAPNKDWTAEELQKLKQHQQQAGLFDDAEARSINTLKKLPHDFYYRYLCKSGGNEKEYRHKIVDWEIGALYWNCVKSHGDKWERPFRKKMEEDMAMRDLTLLLGNMHRFPDQWLNISLIYPPLHKASQDDQGRFDF